MQSLSVVQWDIWTKVVFAQKSQITQEEGKKQVESKPTTQFFMFLRELYYLEMFCDCSIISQQTMKLM